MPRAKPVGTEFRNRNALAHVQFGITVVHIRHVNRWLQNWRNYMITVKSNKDTNRRTPTATLRAVWRRCRVTSLTESSVGRRKRRRRPSRGPDSCHWGQDLSLLVGRLGITKFKRIRMRPE